ncbi:MAG: sulfotransferase domain-containing protein [Actinomycetota bacterium]|nr:sulfotransferase domain-containing protein [Actinomycetota bacterium]
MRSVRPRALLAAPHRRARRFLRRHHNAVLERVPAAALPRGWTVGPPDFVGVGAQRCGTSWWYSALEAHPDVQRVPASPKERHYFDRFWREPFFTEEAVIGYHRLFPRAPGRLIGEWTPGYLHSFWAPTLLKRAAPEARILVMLRDPIDRYVSAVSSFSNGQRSGQIGLPSDAFQRGLYHQQLQRVLAQFARERVLVLQYERCRDQPEEELERSYAFLGLADTGFRPPVLAQRVNATRSEKVVLDGDLGQALRNGYREDAAKLFDDFPELDPALWATLSL